MDGLHGPHGVLRQLWRSLACRSIADTSMRYRPRQLILTTKDMPVCNRCYTHTDAHSYIASYESEKEDEAVEEGQLRDCVYLFRPLRLITGR